MKEQNSAFLKMFTAVVKYVKANNVLINIPAIVSLLKNSDAEILKMGNLFDQIGTDNKAVSIAVDVANEKVTAQLFAVIKALEVFFTKKNDPAMIADLHLTRSALQRATCKSIEAIVKSVVKIARANIAQLAIYNVTEESLTSIESNTLQLVTATAALTAYQEEKKEQAAELERCIDESKEMLAEMDMLVEMVSLTAPTVYKGYTESRNKKEYTELLFTIIVLNYETNKPEENARVKVESTTRIEKGGPYVLLDRKTGKTAEIRNNKREYDVYRITVEKVGRLIYSELFTVADNTPLRIVVYLKNSDPSTNKTDNESSETK